MSKSDLSNIAGQVEKKQKPKKEKNKYLSTGITALNCALSDDPFGGYQLGGIINFMGDSNAGKSLLACTGIACAANDSRFDKYELKIYESEKGYGFDIEKLFGKKTYQRIGNVEPVPHPPLIEPVFDELDKFVENDQPFIAVVDSLDAFKVASDLDRKGSSQKGKSFAGDKPKHLRERLSRLATGLCKTNSLLIIVSQAMPNMGPDAMFRPWRKNGGTAVDFFSQQRFAIHAAGKIKNDSKKVEIGGHVNIKIQRTKATGYAWKIDNIPHYVNLGFDDVGHMCKWLIDEEFWKKCNKKGFKRPQQYILDGFDNIVLPLKNQGGDYNKHESCTNIKQEDIVSFIEENNLENDLRVYFGEKWQELKSRIDEETSKRKPRFS